MTFAIPLLVVIAFNLPVFLHRFRAWILCVHSYRTLILSKLRMKFCFLLLTSSWVLPLGIIVEELYLVSTTVLANPQWIPFVLELLLPFVIKSYYGRNR